MRNGQNNKRMRGRNHNNHGHNNNHGHRKNHNPMSRVFESNGPDVKIRGNPAHIAEKYIQLARDANSSGDPVAAENYYQHAEHYYRLIAAAQEQFRQNNPHLPQQRFENDQPAGARDDDFDDGEDYSGGQQSMIAETPIGTGEQPSIPRDAQPFPQYQQPVARPPQPNESGDVDRLPSFITGTQPQQNSIQPQQGQPPYQGQQNGHDSQGDRFPMHRRRRRHRGGRDFQGGPREDRDDNSTEE
jgi:hypothetical protein